MNKKLSIKNLSNEDKFSLALNVVDCIFTRYGHTDESLDLIKSGRDSIYYPKSKFKIKFSSLSNVYYKANENEKILYMLFMVIYCYDNIKNYDNIEYFNYYINELIEHCYGLLASKFDEHSLITTFLTLINTKYYMINNKLEYVFDSIDGKVFSRYDYSEDYFTDNNYFKYYIGNGSIIIKDNTATHYIIKFNKYYTEEAFNYYMLMIKKSMQDYYDFYHRKRKDKLDNNIKKNQKIFIF